MGVGNVGGLQFQKDSVEGWWWGEEIVWLAWTGHEGIWIGASREEL